MSALVEWRCTGHTRYGQKCTKLLGIFDPAAPGQIKCPSCGHLNIRSTTGPPDAVQYGQSTEAIEPFERTSSEGFSYERDQIRRR